MANRGGGEGQRPRGVGHHVNPTNAFNASSDLRGFNCPVNVDSLDADALAGLVGFTIVAASKVKGDFEGADFEKLVGLDNGMIFQFNEFS